MRWFLLCQFLTPVVLGAVVLLSVPVCGESVAVVSDRVDKPELEAQQVAREVLELQRQMGGSIVPGFGGDLIEDGIPEPVKTPKPRSGRKSPVVALRAGSWQLERLAYRLEKLNLYSQADAVRETARRLRLDARRLQAQSGQPVPPVNGGK
jgi:hypothetical protein